MDHSTWKKITEVYNSILILALTGNNVKVTDYMFSKLRGQINRYSIMSISVDEASTITTHMLKVLMKYGIYDFPKIFINIMNRAGNNLEIIKFLVESGLYKINYRSKCLLFNAVKNDRIEVINYLVRAGVNINARKGYALHLAIIRNARDVVKCLLDNGADLSINNYKALKTAIRRSNLAVVRCLICASLRAPMSDELRAAIYNCTSVVGLLKYTYPNIVFDEKSVRGKY